MLHSVLKLWCKISLPFFFRKWQVHFQSPLPNTPTIFLANHPNAFLDAILIACSIKQKPWFLARGEVFKSKRWAWVLSKLRLMPIFRFRDGHHTLRRNEEIFSRCGKLLATGDSIILFPEGDNSLQFNLLPLQKGFIRIAEAARKANPQLNIQIVPIGIQYSLNTKGFGGTALVNFGEPILYEPFTREKTTEEILALIWERMKGLLLYIERDSYQKKLDYLIANRSHFTDLLKQLHEDQTVIDRYPAPRPEVASLKKRDIIHRINYFYFTVNHFFIRTLIQFVASLVKEEQMKNSVRFVSGMVFTPVLYLLQTAGIWLLTKSWVMATVYLGVTGISIRGRFFDPKR